VAVWLALATSGRHQIKPLLATPKLQLARPTTINLPTTPTISNSTM
jgi:hypothetical protein